MLQAGAQLPDYIHQQKVLYVQAYASSPHYHRALLRHAADDYSVLDVLIIQGGGMAVEVGGMQYTRGHSNQGCLWRSRFSPGSPACVLCRRSRRGP